MAVRTDAGRVSSPFLGISPLFFGPSQIRASVSRCQGPSGKSGVAAWKPLWRLRGFLPVASGPTAGRAVLGNKALPPPWPRGRARLSFLPDPVTPCALPSPLRPSPHCSPSGSGAALPPLGSSAPRPFPVLSGPLLVPRPFAFQATRRPGAQVPPAPRPPRWPLCGARLTRQRRPCSQQAALSSGPARPVWVGGARAPGLGVEGQSSKDAGDLLPWPQVDLLTSLRDLRCSSPSHLGLHILRALNPGLH